MSEDSTHSEFGRGRRVIETVRRRLQRVEIETHLIRADLAQFEAAHESGIAQALQGKIDDSPPVSELQVAAPAEPAAVTEAPLHSRQQEKSEFRPAQAAVVRVDLSPKRERTAKPELADLDDSPIPPLLKGAGEAWSKSGVGRWASSAWLVSVLVHFILLAVCGSLTYAILVDESPPHSMTLDLSADSELPSVEASPSDAVEIAESDAPEAATGDGPMNLADVAIADPLPFTADATAEPVQGLGELDKAPTDTGTLAAGLGTEGAPEAVSTGPGGGSRDGVTGGRGHGGKPGRRPKSNSAIFFGTEAVGDRIVFLVDNSGSMKQGRMETTLMELLRSIDAMTKDQSFYIVFYSDQAYPMFYPNNELRFVTATPENKRRLMPWLQSIELCTGGKLGEAIDLAASLHPDVVYILSDGDINSPRTMQKMTEPNDWDFVIHALGMGVKKPAAADNLNAIAQAHHGKFQMVQASPAAMQMAHGHPIKSNPMGTAWGMGGPLKKP
jgi:hypothetical protein